MTPTHSENGAAGSIGVIVVLLYRRSIVAAALLIAFVVGVVILVRHRTYTSSVSFLPVVGRSPGGNLAGIAASLGFNLGGSDVNQSPQFYADLVTTPTILMPIVEGPLSGDSIPQPVTLEALFKVKGSTVGERRDNAVEELQRHLHVTLKPRTGVVRVDATMDDPRQAHAVIVHVLDQLGTFNISSRQSQASAERRFTELRTAEAKQELRVAEDSLRQFERANRDRSTSPDLRFEEDRRQREVNLRQQIYTTLAEAYERARIDEVRDTPVLSVVEPPLVPAEPDHRGVILKVLGALFAGSIAVTLFVIALSAMGILRTAGAEALDLEQLLAATRTDLRHPIRGFRDFVRTRA
ncbi:MAG TPA: hypothetical protein VGI92_11655 [Gemmatimonadales bacterium]